MNHWHLLGIAPTSDERAIKRAYAKRLKQTHPEDDPQGFQALRAAYENALRQAPYLSDEDFEATEEGMPEPLMAIVEEAPAPLSEGVAETHALNVWEQADSLLNRFAALAHAGESGLSDTLRQWLHDDTLLNMDLRLAFEEYLLHWLARLETLPPTFVEEAAQTFYWHDGVGHLTADAGYAWQHLWGRMLVLRGQRDLERMAQTGTGYGIQPSGYHEVWARCARLLRMPYARWRFHWAALSGNVQDAMGALLNHLAHQTPGTLETLDAQTVAWWQRAVAWPRIRTAQIVIAIISASVLALLVNDGMQWAWCKSLGESALSCGQGPAWIWFYLALLPLLFALSLAGVLALQHGFKRGLWPRIRTRLSDPLRLWFYGLEPARRWAYWLLLVMLSIAAADALPESWRWLAFLVYGASVLWLMHFYLQFFLWMIALLIATEIQARGLHLGLSYATVVMLSHFLLVLAASAAMKRLGAQRA